MADVQLPIRSVRKRPKLDSLPQEVCDFIFEHASSPETRLKHHLWPLLFVSRQMYHAVLPTLYRRISFEIDSSVGSYKANYKLLQMSDKENQGLLHIEEVHLYPRDELRRKSTVTADYPDAIQLLGAVPKDQLRRFRWDSCHHMPSGILRLLWKRQHKLINVELVSCTKPVDKLVDEFGPGGESFHEHATELSIADVGRGTIPAVALRILKERAQIDALTLDFRSIEETVDDMRFAYIIDHDDRSRARKEAQHDTLREASLEGLLKELFRPPKQVQPAFPLGLRTLHLYHVDLSYAPKYLLPGLDLRVLRSLHVVCCRSPYVLLEGLSQLPVAKRPQLRELHIYHDGKDSTPVSNEDLTDRLLHNINEALLSTEKDTLLDLWIVLREISHTAILLNPLAAGIVNHGKSLLRLTADVRSLLPVSSARTGDQYVGWFGPETWEEVCASMGRLEQLYVPFPPIVADEHMTARPEYYSYLDTALQIPTLKTLNTTTWPYPLDTILHDHEELRRPFARIPYFVGPLVTRPRRSYLPVPFYHHCLKYIADYIVRRRNHLVSDPRKPLHAVGFGLLERDHFMKSLEEWLEPVYFFRSPMKLPEGALPVLEQWSYKEIQRTSACGLVDGVVDIDWLIKKTITERVDRH
ncbi:MAG: hypothetical protein Q9168_003204 [Polycauliona sp. 1 TL-2023]